MVIVLLYLIANLVLSTIVEKNRRGTTVICHAVLFFFTLTMLLMCSDVPVFGNLAKFLMGDVYDSFLSDVMCGNRVAVMVPFVLVEFFAIVQMVISVLFVATEVVCGMFAANRKKYVFIADEHRTSRYTTVPVYTQKLYCVLSVLRC